MRKLHLYIDPLFMPLCGHPILQDFVPYRGRCPATAQLQPKNYIKRGKGTADHMLPLGAWLLFSTGQYG